MSFPKVILVIIVVGAAFIISIAVSLYLLHPPLQEVPISIEISGLKDTYKAGEPINFNVTIIGECFVYPQFVMIKDLRNGKTVWLFNGTILDLRIMGAPPCSAISGETYSTEEGIWNNGYWIKSPIIINKTGDYDAIAKYANAEEEQEFYVTSNDINHNTTPSQTNLSVQAPIFGPSWHYAGNETISGDLAMRLCSIPPTPCAEKPAFTANKYVNDKNDTTALLVTRWEGHTDQNSNIIRVDEYDTVLVNSSVYCVRTNLTDTSNQLWTLQYAKCPSLIN